MKTLVERFEDKIFYSPCGCWFWIGAVSGRKPMVYGSIGVGDKVKKAHRVSYELHKGEVPDGLCVCHSCDNPLCVNPDHLFLGTEKENADDRDKKGRRNPLRGEVHGNAVLTDDVAKQIKAVALSGVKNTVVAKQFSCSPETVSRIKNGNRRWSTL